MIVIADLAGGYWSKASREASRGLTDSYRAIDARTSEMELLNDVRTVLTGWKGDQIPTAVLIEELDCLEESRWHERGITPRVFAQALGEFDIKPGPLRDGLQRGFNTLQLKHTIERYLSSHVDQLTSVKSVKRRKLRRRHWA